MVLVQCERLYSRIVLITIYTKSLHTTDLTSPLYKYRTYPTDNFSCTQIICEFRLFYTFVDVVKN